MAVKIAPDVRMQFFTSQGSVLTGGQLFAYVAGSTTKQDTYTDSTGLVKNSNPIVLNSDGRTPNGVWLIAGAAYKFVLAPANDTDPPASPIWTEDNVSGVNDTSVTQSDEWVASNITPTYVSATSFTMAGDQTTEFHVGRRLKSTNTGGTIYSTIITSAYAALTTVTVVNDVSSLDSGLSAVSYGIARAAHPSIDADMVNRKGAAVASAATTDIWSTNGNYVHVTGSTGPITSFGTAPYAGARRTVMFDSTPTITHGSSLKLPGAQSITAVANMIFEVVAETTSGAVVISASVPFSRPAQFPPGHLFGLTLSNNVADATNDIDITTGSCRDSGDTMDIVLASALTKQLDVAWAVGTNQGMRATGAVIANTTYHLFLIKRSDTGVVDVAADTSITGANVAANTNAAYTTIRRIGSILREGGVIVAFSQIGDEFLRLASVLDVSAANPGTAAVSRTLSVPVGGKVYAIVNWAIGNAAAGVAPNVFISSLDQTDAAASATAAPLGNAGAAVQTAVGGSAGWNAQLITRTSTAAAVRSRLSASDGNVTLYAATIGWIDRRGRDA